MTDKQPEALRLAEQYDYGDPAAHSNMWKAAVCTELRRQHARIAELEAQLEAIGAGGVSGSKLRDGENVFASVSAHSTRHTGRTGWFWVAGCGSGIPHYNSCGDPGLTEDEAKAAAMAYVKKHLAQQQKDPS